MEAKGETTLQSVSSSEFFFFFFQVQARKRRGRRQVAGRFMQTFRVTCAAIDQAGSTTERPAATVARASSNGASDDVLRTRASVSLKSSHEFNNEKFSKFVRFRRIWKLRHRQGKTELVSILSTAEVLISAHEHVSSAGGTRTKKTKP